MWRSRPHGGGGEGRAKVGGEVGGGVKYDRGE